MIIYDKSIQTIASVTATDEVNVSKITLCSLFALNIPEWPKFIYKPKKTYSEIAFEQIAVEKENTKFIARTEFGNFACWLCTFFQFYLLRIFSFDGENLISSVSKNEYPLT